MTASERTAGEVIFRTLKYVDETGIAGTREHRGRDQLKKSTLFKSVPDEHLNELDFDYPETPAMTAFIHMFKDIDFDALRTWLGGEDGASARDAYTPAQVLHMLSSNSEVKDLFNTPMQDVIFIVQGGSGLRVMAVGNSAWHAGKLCLNLIPFASYGSTGKHSFVLVTRRHLGGRK
jgi:hypothetical protein